MITWKEDFPEEGTDLSILRRKRELEDKGSSLEAGFRRSRDRYFVRHLPEPKRFRESESFATSKTRRRKRERTTDTWQIRRNFRPERMRGWSRPRDISRKREWPLEGSRVCCGSWRSSTEVRTTSEVGRRRNFGLGEVSDLAEDREVGIAASEDVAWPLVDLRWY
jgi:hypothetical protein